MPRPLVDLLWRDHPDALSEGARGPRSRCTTADVVSRAVALADLSGLDAVTIRALGEALGISTMSVYTHINSRDDLLVLMADNAHAQMALPGYGRAGWRTRVRRVAEANRGLLRTHPWLLQITDARAVLGPGTIAKYDHELHAFDTTSLSNVDRDAALAFLLDFVRASATAHLATPIPEQFDEIWRQTAGRLSHYLGANFPLAQQVGRDAGEEMRAPYSAQRAWEFGLARVLAGLADIIDS